MIAELRDLKACEVSRSAAQQELERLLADPRFRVTERQKDILRYLARCRFEGGEEGVKAYAIALDVLGRSSDFDASTDPIVRIEISRLRSSLDAYYEAFGAPENATVYIPKGMYIALFPATFVPHRPDEEVSGNPDAASVDQPAACAFHTSADRQSSGSRPLWAGAAVVTLVTLAAGALASVTWLAYAPSLIEKPVVYVLMEAVDGRMEGEASQIRDTLMTALTQFTTLTVAKSGYPVAGADKRAGRSYELHLKYYGNGEDRSVWWQVADSKTDLVLKSGLDTVDSSGRSMVSVREEIAGRLASSFASIHGVINTIEIQEDADDALGNTCVLRAEHALDDGGQARLAKARVCLEQSLALAPKNPDATAVLSRVMLAGKSAAQDPGVRLTALELAKDAVSLAPLSDRAQIALMAAQFAAGSMDAAIQAGNRAVELNPNNSDAAAKLAFVLYLGGYRDAGVAMAHGAGLATETIPSDAMLVLALDAYREGRYSEASLFAEQINGTDLLVAMLRTAALGQLSSPEVVERLSELKDKTSDPNGGFRNGMSWWRLQQSITTELEGGLIKAAARAEEGTNVSIGQR
ncbi:Flp pilus assembly protein TadD, contains TPR repeats [Rhizobium sp. NFR07]|uniref:tetratricopeptide repeat protein n=1 Tax=Rhizobium sp. NFR07 TaxID=1566262 RepID=UPI0008F0908F|nr:hypothetical protein [Rhizobium sp. NFR07]SFB32600.1 Flp pilus assembly protein TadD, contains TPR repeats [Rhizobium sp. NFR07]